MTGQLAAFALLAAALIALTVWLLHRGRGHIMRDRDKGPP